MNQLQTYRKFIKYSAGAACVAGVLAGAIALAANPTLRELDVTKADDTIDVSGRLTGLGNRRVDFNITVFGTVTETCTTPSGKNEPPGQREFEDTTRISLVPDDKNGNLNFSIPVEFDPGDADCPNPKWSSTQEVDVDGARVIISQGGVLIADQTCTFPEGSDVAQCEPTP